jgi:hypothetical protein
MTQPKVAKRNGWFLFVRTDSASKNQRKRPTFVFFDEGVERVQRWADAKIQVPTSRKYPAVPADLIRQAAGMDTEKMQLKKDARRAVKEGKQKQITTNPIPKTISPPQLSLTRQYKNLEILYHKLLHARATGDKVSQQQFQHEFSDALHSTPTINKQRWQTEVHSITAKELNQELKLITASLNELTEDQEEAFDEENTNKANKLESKIVQQQRNLDQVTKIYEGSLVDWGLALQSPSAKSIKTPNESQQALIKSLLMRHQKKQK